MPSNAFQANSVYELITVSLVMTSFSFFASPLRRIGTEYSGEHATKGPTPYPLFNRFCFFNELFFQSFNLAISPLGDFKALP